ncbi:MAG TPA: flagellar biosynthesis protein FlhF [Phycisphaerae bacterium]|nr:flagellar biosynthesis protein FlhF [Phycisphaerae bacterium]HRY69748.1 flagellar biosynthesis protein FlhF [Phycisphaerae bacterium]HSA29388.1 flagellar biosynthesis protein FlhF [Phycisphaerae bacterium]
MELKTYQAHSMAEALEKVKRELGPDAVILNTRTIRRGGVLGVGARDVIEITASRDRDALPAVERRAMAYRAAGAAGRPSPAAEPLRSASSRSSLQPSSSQPQVKEDLSLEEGLGDRGSTEVSALTSGLRDEMREIRGMVSELLNRPAVATPAAPAVPAEFQDYYTRLLQNAVAEELAREVIAKARERLDDCRTRILSGVAGRLDHAQAEEKVAAKLNELVPAVLSECIERMLPAAEPATGEAGDPPKVMALVGPTGVGKTTTIAKLAAQFRLREHKTVGLITIDTYRIAAVDQLKAYAEIMSLPLEVVFTPEELGAAVVKLRHCDVILIDTSGRSHRDLQRLGELRAFLDAARRAAEPSRRPRGQAARLKHAAGNTPKRGSGRGTVSARKRLEVHLLLSCTCHQDQLLQVAERFAALDVDRVVFTKLDEAVGLGVILNVASRLKWRMSYLTTGQEVPDDIEVGHRRRVAEMLLRARSDATAEGRSSAPQAGIASVDQLA